jgi:diaminohydroxyphosphoribosylaminopyrimidine deaminase/5-amino-6-(5-phosphoribosylamino)uracil reductase
MTKDEFFMRRALALAKKGGQNVASNPMVGCVIVKNGRILAEGAHLKFGGPHAEPRALLKAGTRAQGATAYINLEPCVDHLGKRTPPCAPALVQAGIARVVCAVKDANPAVSGKGLALLRRNGIKVDFGVLSKEAEQLNAGFFSRMRRHRPWVILKTALSLDGRAYAEGGESRWITGPESRKKVHELRSRVNAILIGTGTALADNPELTSHGAGANPLRVLLDSRLRIRPSARLLDGRAKTLIFTAAQSGSRRNAEIVRVRRLKDGLDLKAVLKELARRGVNRLLVEGGPTVHASFLRARLVDEAWIFLAPKLLSGASDPNGSPRILRPTLRRLGQDFLFYGQVF